MVKPDMLESFYKITNKSTETRRVHGVQKPMKFLQNRLVNLNKLIKNTQIRQVTREILIFWIFDAQFKFNMSCVYTNLTLLIYNSFQRMRAQHFKLGVALIILQLIMISSGNWVKYQTYTGHFPSYVYSVTLNAGDRLKAVLSWPDNVDLDLYLYSDGMNLLSRNIWVDQQFSGSLNPQILQYTIVNPGLYHLRADLFGNLPRPYQLKVYVNDVLENTYYDTVFKVSSGLTVTQFAVQGSCTIKIEYDGPEYPIQLYKPGANVLDGNPAASNTTGGVNPKQIIYTLTQGGLWSFVIRQGLSTIYFYVPYKFTIYTDPSDQCQSYCSRIPNTVGTIIGYNQRCECIDNFNWDDVNKVCVIDCNLVEYTVGILAGTIDQCQCKDKYNFDSTLFKCNLDCQQVPRSTGELEPGSTTQCACEQNYLFDSTALECILDCSQVEFSTGLAPGSTTECACQPPRLFDNTDLTCQFDCQNVAYSTGPVLGTTDRCLCEFPLVYYSTTGQCSYCKYLDKAKCACSNKHLFDPVEESCILYCYNIPHAKHIDGVTDRCKCVLGYAWSAMFSKCEEVCGDGIQTETEECDDGNLVKDDGCSNYCKLEEKDSSQSSSSSSSPSQSSSSSSQSSSSSSQSSSPSEQIKIIAIERPPEPRRRRRPHRHDY